MLRKIFRHIEALPITFHEWVIGFVCIIFLRTFLENFSSLPASHTFMSTPSVFVHFYLFYTSITLAIILLLYLCTQRNIYVVSKVVLFGALLIIAPPIIDLIITSGTGTPLGYLITHKETLLHDYLTFITLGLPGISFGIRLEFVMMIGLAYAYVRMHSTTIRAISASIALYTLFFVYYTLPSILHIDTSFRFLATIKNSLFAHVTSSAEGIQTYFDIAISHPFYLSIVIFGALYAYILHRPAFIALCKNSRMERVGHYFVMILSGIALSLWVGDPAPHIRNWLDVTTYIILFFSYYATWMYAVLANDRTDVVSDAVSNKNRPLVSGAVSLREAKNYEFVFLLLALVGGYIAGSYTLYLIMVFMVLSYIYSMPPLHLKRFPILNPFIIGLASLSAMLAGFYTINQDSSLGAIPLSFILLIVTTITLIANVKDIKDIEGDAKVGVYTIPVIFGIERGKKIIALLAIFALACVPLFTGLTLLWYLFVPFAWVTYYLIVMRPFTEKYLFGIYFLYILLCFGVYAL